MFTFTTPELERLQDIVDELHTFTTDPVRSANELNHLRNAIAQLLLIDSSNFN